MTEAKITKLLADKHGKDVFISQCNHGPGHQTMRMDAWAMTKSWANPCYYAYEIKVSRSDFLKDEKYRHYMKFCNQFYFVCPAKLIDPSELPGDCGLLWVSSTGTRLYTKKKAPYRKIEEPVGVLLYILMWRTSVSRGSNNYKDVSAYNYWKDWLYNKNELLSVGHRVSRRLGELIKKEISEVRQDNKIFKNQIEKLQTLKDKCEELGIDIFAWNIDGEIRKKQAEICGNGICDEIDNAIKKLRSLKNTIMDVVK